MSPVQAKIMTVTDRSKQYAEKVADWLKEKGVRVEVDARNEKIGYKIREAQVEKVPYMLVVGDKEMENGTVAVRKRGEGDKGAVNADDFVALITKEIKEKVR